MLQLQDHPCTSLQKSGWLRNLRTVRRETITDRMQAVVLSQTPACDAASEFSLTKELLLDHSSQTGNSNLSPCLPVDQGTLSSSAKQRFLVISHLASQQHQKGDGHPTQPQRKHIVIVSLSLCHRLCVQALQLRSLDGKACPCCDLCQDKNNWRRG